MHNKFKVTLTFKDGTIEVFEETPRVKIYSNRIYVWKWVEKDWYGRKFNTWEWTFRSLINVTDIKTEMIPTDRRE